MIGISSNSLLLIWIRIEINLLSFIPLAINKTKYSIESILKYFLIQSIASALFLIRTQITIYAHPLTTHIIILTIIIKTGAAPFHQWIPSVMEGIPWPTLFILITIQKIIPLSVTAFIVEIYDLNLLLWIFIIRSATLGSLGGINQQSLMKLIAYSSIAHIAWLLTRIIYNQTLWLIYFIIYSLINISVVSIFFIRQSNSLTSMLINNKKNILFILSANILSVAGLPPFTGILPKLIVIQQIIYQINTFIILPLLARSFLRLFFYLRITLNIIITRFNTNSFFFYQPDYSPTALWLNIITLTIPSILIIFLLNFKLIKLKAFKAFNKNSLSLMRFKLIKTKGLPNPK